MTNSKKLVFTYPAERWVQGSILTILFMILAGVFFYVFAWDQLPAKIIISIALLAIFDSIYDIYVSWRLAPRRLVIESGKLIGEFASGEQVIVELRNIDKIVERKSVWIWRHQFAVRIISTHENKEILVGVYLTGPDKLIDVIKAANPSCLISSSWLQKD